MKPNVLIATNMLGMGPRPGEIDECRSDPQGWVAQQIIEPDKLLPEYQKAPSALELIEYSRKVSAKRRKSRKTGSQKDNYGFIAERFRADIDMRHMQAVKSRTSFVERWARFWSNHFTVSARNKFLSLVAGSFERDAIRPHIFGRFSDMLKASTLHPAMLHYLDNSHSIGPNSPFGRRRNGSINENLAREILELHTLGVDGGYDLDDIKALANALTGWHHAGLPKAPGKRFFPDRHEPGPVTLLGQKFPDTGEDHIHDVLDALARHPSTARYISQKLARHFIGYVPDEKTISVLAQAFLDSDGDLANLAHRLVELDAVWSQSRHVFKRPEDYLVSVGRSVPDWEEHYAPILTKLLGQAALKAPGPDGWELTGRYWMNSENIVIRVGWFLRHKDTMPSWLTPDLFIHDTFDGHLSRQTLSVMKAADDARSAIILAFLSPEFLRR